MNLLDPTIWIAVIAFCVGFTAGVFFGTMTKWGQ